MRLQAELPPNDWGKTGRKQGKERLQDGNREEVAKEVPAGISVPERTTRRNLKRRAVREVQGRARVMSRTRRSRYQRKTT